MNQHSRIRGYILLCIYVRSRKSICILHLIHMVQQQHHITKEDSITIIYFLFGLGRMCQGSLRIRRRVSDATYLLMSSIQNDKIQTKQCFIHESVIIMVDQSFQKLSFRYQNIVMICTKRVHTWFVTSTLPLPEKKSMIKRGIKEKLYSYIVNMSKFNHDSHYLSFLQNNSSPVSLCYGQLLIEDIGS